jgi:hypothetical protein
MPTEEEHYLSGSSRTVSGTGEGYWLGGRNRVQE